YYETTDELLKQKLDIVVICTPPFAHHELVIKAAEAGCHILVEKPFAMNSKESEEMIAAARRNNVKLCVSHNFLFSRSMKRVKQLRDSNELGKVTGAIALQLSNLKRRLPTWYPSLPGGLFFDESPHMLYSILEFLGDVSVEWAGTTKFEDNRQPLSRVEALMASKSTDATAYLRFAFDAPRDEWILMIMGTKRVMLVDFFRDTVMDLAEGGEHTAFEVLSHSLNYMWQYTKETANSGVRLLARNLYFGHSELIRRFIDSIENDTEVPVSAESGKQVIELIEQILSKGQK
ncbi:Gfo/Idh/MocA family oxidoreductase, partial [Candidatus Bathyarchaeota archaeon]|nr:Gfo/Idh/MocA family oxidoreductase [Candidatus Bathyarchaeota archaeon]